MELRHLRYFVAVAEELHFTRAADRLHVAQPGLSQQIRRLERELGVDLFRRAHHSVELTETGRVFLEHARRVLDDVDVAERAVRQAAHGDLGRLAIGFVPYAAGALLPELLVAYCAQHPRVDIELRDLRAPEQIDALVDGRIQIGLFRHRPDEPRLQFLRLRRHQVLVAMPASHRLAGLSSLQLGELSGERWIQPDNRSGFLFSACARAGFEPLIAQHATQPETRLALVAAGVGLALVSESTPHLPSRHVVYIPLDRPKLTVDLDAAWHKDRRSPLIDGFLEIARSTIQPAPSSRRS